MRRRFFLAAPALLPAVAKAQPQLPLIGIVRVGSEKNDLFVPTFKRDMARLGYEENKNYRTQALFANGDSSRVPALVAELVKAGASITVLFGNPAVVAAQKVAANVAVVAMADDLAGDRLVASMGRPGGNITGVSVMGIELDPKRLEVLHEVVPKARRIAVFLDEGFRGDTAVGSMEQAAAKLGLQLVFVRIQKPEQVEPAMSELVVANVDAVQFLASPFLNAQRAFFVDRLRKLKLPAMYEWPETVEEGGLMSYAPRVTLVYRHVAVQVAKLLKGAKPADLPIEQPTIFTLALNTGVAKAIGLTLPEAILLRADLVVD